MKSDEKRITRRFGRTPPRRRFSSLLFFSCLLSLALCHLPYVLAREAAPQPSGLHLWGAVTLFHGLPSEQVRAVTQDADGAMWFGTDAGPARYDGRRTQTVTGDGLAGRRVNALRAGPDGALWVGTDDGAFVRANGAEPFRLVAETKGRRVTAVAVDETGRAILTTADGYIFECTRGADGAFAARSLGAQLTVATGKGQPLELTSVAVAGQTVVVGTRGRGLMTTGPGGTIEEIAARPRAFFVEAVEVSGEGALIYGAQTSDGDSGLYRADASRLTRPEKLTGAATGTVTAIATTTGGETYAATAGRGVFRFRAGGSPERLTFAGTAGGLRSDKVNAVFVDREGVVWFGTDRGVCRYDPHGIRVETLSADESEANFVRALLRTSRGRLLAGTNRGLYSRDDDSSPWRAIEEIRGKTVYALAEDGRGRLLIATAGGLFVGLQAGARPTAPLRFAEPGGGAGDGTNRKSAADGTAAKTGTSDKQSGSIETSRGPVKDVTGARDKGPIKNEGATSDGPAGVAASDDESSRARDAEAGATARKIAAPALPGSVRGAAVFRGATYVATFGRGLERFDGHGSRTLIWPREGDDARGREPVSLYVEESTGRLWIGTANAGVFYYDGDAVKAEASLASLGGGTIWGFASADDHLWLATSRGLYALAPGGLLVEAKTGVDARSVVALKSSDGVPRVWCATAGGGVLRVALDARFGPVVSRLDTEHGLPSQSAFALLVERSGPEAGERLSIGTTRGVARYEAGRLAPSLALVRVTASRTHQPEELGAGALSLEYPQNSFVADFAAGAGRTFPEQFQYAFTLEDSAGRIVKRRLSHDSQFQADELAAGRYVVTARSYSLDLVASEPLRLEFLVARAPFPWTTLSLSVLLGLALVALLWAGVQHRRAVLGGEELREANHQLAAARLQLANEAEAERRRIARDLHDQTLADLRRLLLLIDEMQRAGAFDAPAGIRTPAALAATQTASVDPALLRAEIEAVSHEIRRICEDLSPSVLENVGFAAALEWALASARAHLPAEEQFAYEFDCEENLEERLALAPGVQMQVYRIVQEAVNNVCRHASAARVVLSARLDEEDAFVVRLEDDGRGFDASDKKKLKGRGLAGIRARAAIVEAEVSWRRRSVEEGGGTVFELRKPYATVKAA